MPLDYKISASVVLYNGFAQAKSCILSILDFSRDLRLQLYLIDNASPDGSGLQLEKTFASRATVIRCTENLGFGQGHNICLPMLESKYHAVINPDITLEEDTLSVLCRYLDEHPDVAMVTPQLRFPDGTQQNVAKRVPTLLALLSRQFDWKWLRPYENYYLMLDRDLSQPQEIQFCTGCFFVIRTEVLRAVGGFDKDYFMFVEDADITRRVMQHGRVVYLPDTHVIHAWNREAKRSRKAFFMQLRSMFVYFRKWGYSIGPRKRAERFEPSQPADPDAEK